MKVKKRERNLMQNKENLKTTSVISFQLRNKTLDFLLTPAAYFTPSEDFRSKDFQCQETFTTT